MYDVIPNTLLTIANLFFCIAIADIILRLETTKSLLIYIKLVTSISSSLFTTYVLYGNSIQFMIFSVINSTALTFTFIMFFATFDDYECLKKQSKK